MSRNINICINQVYFRMLEGFDSVDINNLDSIVNYSVNAIIVDNFNLIDRNILNVMTQKILEKLTVGGQVILRFLDAKMLAQKYIDNSITDDEFLKYAQSLKSAITIETINDALDANFIIDNIDKSEIYTVIKIIRINIA